MPQSPILDVINAYRHPIVRAYALGRFGILRQRFLSEIGQYLPEQGRVLDIGCGFGLFSLYYASTRPGLTLTGFDLNTRRVAMATEAAARLGLTNVRYEPRDARAFQAGETYDAVYMLDIVHHIPPDAVRPLLEEIYRVLPPGGRLLLKDVDTKPTYKRLFTHALDWAMDPRSPVHYWSTAELRELLSTVGFRVHNHLMVDFLPYPHVLYICQKPAQAAE
jgi:2-polyprenyl-6-hydroxyphenyl methylase/3-demethylubiquinone-9 3-methyltransferase